MDAPLIDNTLYVNYTKRGEAIADHETEAKLLKKARICVNGQRMQFNVSTENAINAVRAMKINGKITCNVIILFEDEYLPMDEKMKLKSWPNGFCDYITNWLDIIILNEIKKK